MTDLQETPSDSESVHSDSDVQSEVDDDEPIAVPNTLLAYTRYGMSTATPDNLREVLASHFTFDEIIKAKNVLWSECTMLKHSEPPKRQNSNQRTVNVAHVIDIVDAMYKADAAGELPNFVVEPQGIARLPRLNPEKLNVVAIDQRIADLEERNHVLEIQSSVDRTKYLMCIDRLEHVESILQQHTNTLRIMQGKLVSPRSIDGVQHQSVPIVPTQIDGSSPNRYIDPTRLATPPNLAAQLSVTSSKTLNPTATTFNPESNRSNSPQSTQSMPTFGTSGATGSPIQGAISGSPPAPTRKSYGEMASSNYGLMSSDNPPSTRDKRNPRTLRKDSQSQSRDYKFCAFSVNDNQTEQEVGIPHGYQKSKASKDMDRYKEKKRQKVVHGTADSLNCFFRGGKQRSGNKLHKFNKCDLFLQHCDHSTTVELVKHHLQMNNIDTSGIRVDVATKEIAEFRSFRMLAPDELRETLLQPHLWPEGVRVKDYVVYKKSYKSMAKSKYQH